jgi:hypothetical protein
LEETVWESPRDVGIQLAELGLAVEPLSVIVQAGYHSYNTRTSNDAPNAGGFYQWNDTLRALREYCVRNGWRRNDDKGFPTVVSAERTIALCVSSGNENTGIAAAPLGTKNSKGPCTQHLVEDNRIALFEFPSDPRPVRLSRGAHKGRAIPTWALLFYNAADEIRSEVSLPVFFADARIQRWATRIILPAIPREPDDHRRIIDPDFGPDIDIDIRRRA